MFECHSDSIIILLTESLCYSELVEGIVKTSAHLQLVVAKIVYETKKHSDSKQLKHAKQTNQDQNLTHLAIIHKSYFILSYLI